MELWNTLQATWYFSIASNATKHFHPLAQLINSISKIENPPPNNAITLEPTKTTKKHLNTSSPQRSLLQPRSRQWSSCSSSSSSSLLAINFRAHPGGPGRERRATRKRLARLASSRAESLIYGATSRVIALPIAQRSAVCSGKRKSQDGGPPSRPALFRQEDR